MNYGKGNPPSVGWWPTGTHTLRWWNGEAWSWPCMDSDRIHWVEYYSSKIDPKQVGIRWVHRPDSWPERSKT